MPNLGNILPCWAEIRAAGQAAGYCALRVIADTTVLVVHEDETMEVALLVVPWSRVTHVEPGKAEDVKARMFDLRLAKQESKALMDRLYPRTSGS